MATWGDLNTVPMGGRPPQGGIFNRMTAPPVQREDVPLKGPAPYTGGGDLWERIQNESRKGSRYDEWTIMDPYSHSGGSSHLGTRGDLRTLTPEQQRVLDQYGVKASWRDGYTTGPQGEGATVEDVPGQWEVDGMGTYDRTKMPKTVFGHDFRTVTERDKGLIPKEDAIVWDDNYGWITHRKNYDQNGNETWFMKNAKTIMPALFTMGLGSLGVAPGVLSSINLGRSAVDFLGGNSGLGQLLPALLSAGIGFSGLPGMLSSTLGRFGGSLATNALRTGGNMAISNLTNRGRGG